MRGLVIPPAALISVLLLPLISTAQGTVIPSNAKVYIAAIPGVFVSRHGD
jgi:hypothetical protein